MLFLHVSKKLVNLLHQKNQVPCVSTIYVFDVHSKMGLIIRKWCNVTNMCAPLLKHLPSWEHSKCWSVIEPP